MKPVGREIYGVISSENLDTVLDPIGTTRQSYGALYILNLRLRDVDRNDLVPGNGGGVHALHAAHAAIADLYLERCEQMTIEVQPVCGGKSAQHKQGCKDVFQVGLKANQGAENPRDHERPAENRTGGLQGVDSVFGDNIAQFPQAAFLGLFLHGRLAQILADAGMERIVALECSKRKKIFAAAMHDVAG